MIDDLIPLPVVVKGLDHKWNQDNAPEVKTEIRKTNISADNRQDAEDDEAESVWQAVHRRDEAGGVAMACH